MRVWSPGARVGHAWLKVVVTNGMLLGLASDGRGMATGRLGLDVAEVGKGGSDNEGPVTPGTRSATTRSIALAFCQARGESEPIACRGLTGRSYLDLEPVGRRCVGDDVKHEFANVLRGVNKTWVGTPNDGLTSTLMAWCRLAISELLYMNRGGDACTVQRSRLGGSSRGGEKNRTDDNFSSHFFRFFSLRLTTLVHWPSSGSPAMASGRSGAGEDGETGRCRFIARC